MKLDVKPEAANGITIINVGVLYSAKGHRGFLRDLALQFQKTHPNIRVIFNGQLDADYKKSVPQWMSSDGDMDVLYWQGGRRLQEYIEKGLVHQLDTLWQQNNFDQIFPETIKNAVAADNHVYAIPYAYYAWGMFYNKQVLKRLKIDAPTNWQQLISLCRKAKKAQIDPLMIASKDPWLPAAWFDYINLRLNGLKFHLSLLKGDESFLDERVEQTFSYWAELINSHCFNHNQANIDWRGLLPPIIRQLAAGTLIANFVDIDMPAQFAKDITFKPFPDIKTGYPRYEDMPVDVFLIPQNSRNKQAAEKFLLFLSKPEVQSAISDAMAQSSPHRYAARAKGHFTQQNQTILNDAAGIAQYFDRDMPQPMVNDSLAILKAFLVDPNIVKTQQALEDIRLAYKRGTLNDENLQGQF